MLYHPRMDTAPITPDEFRSRLVKLCLSSGGYGLPRRVRDRWIVLKSATLGFGGDRTYSEREVNASLAAWLRDVGPAVESDHVSLRRALVDDAFLERAPGGEWYRLGPKARDARRFDPGVDAIVPDRVIREAQAEREAKRRAHAPRPGH